MFQLIQTQDVSSVMTCLKCIREFLETWPKEEHAESHHFVSDSSLYGARGSVVVKALCYQPEGHGFETR
jgi:hypothetical protein